MATVTDNLSEVSNIIVNRNFHYIGIDETNEAGKSTLASKLSETLALRHINLDDYLDKEQGGFLDFLKYNELEQQITGLDKFILDGVCLLNELEKIQASIDCLIYVKRMSHSIWADEVECDIEGNVENFIQKEKEVLAILDKTNVLPESLGLAEEIIRYHAKYKPHEKADIIFERNDC